MISTAAPPQTEDNELEHESTESPLRSIHTDSFPALLNQLGISVAVSTYQAGKLVLLRADGDQLNTHFRGFNKPMGLALRGDQLAIGTALEIWEFHNVPAAANRLNDETTCDACFLPRGSHCTGDIQIHEMEWGEDDLWFVNTRFSCLCTRSINQSFVPRWRPSFISQLAPEDRCHLNGLTMLDGRPVVVTALGKSDSQGGWRENKASGGIVIDVESGEIITRGLSMPHSPRLRDGRLWALNSGCGGVGVIDFDTGQYESITQLPGFTRGLSFYDRYAFIGLSQVRESAIFSGIPIAQLDERSSGIWVLDTVTGQTVAWLKFEESVREIFAVTVIPNRRMPDVINDDRRVIANSFIVPDESLADVPQQLVRRGSPDPADATTAGLPMWEGCETLSGDLRPDSCSGSEDPRTTPSGNPRTTGTRA